MIIEISPGPCPILSLIILLTIVIVCYEIIPFLFNKTGMPDLIGWIILGIILASLSIGDMSIAKLLQINFNSSNFGNSKGLYSPLIEMLSNVGVTLLIFSISLKMSIKDMISVGKTAFIVALSGAMVPFIFGFAFIILLYDIKCALFMAATMVATSVGVTAYVIKNLHLLHTKEAKIIIGAAIADDVLGVIILAVVSWIASGNAYAIDGIFSYTVVSIITIALSTHFIIPWIQKNIRKNSIKLIPFIFSILFCAILAYATEKLHLSLLIGAFTAGLILSKHAETWELNKKIESLTNYILPFFFIFVGLHVYGIDSHVILIIVIIVVLAIAGKYFGCFIAAKRIDKSMSAKSASIIGVGMIPRGEVGIIVATIGSESVMPHDLYTVAVLMSVITTTIAPPFLSMLLKRKYGNNTNLEK